MSEGMEEWEGERGGERVAAYGAVLIQFTYYPYTHTHTHTCIYTYI